MRITVADNGDVVPSVDAITLNVVDKKFGIVLPVFKAAPPDGDHLFTAVPTEAIPPVSLEYLERLARIAAEDTPFACGSPPCVLAGRDVPFFFGLEDVVAGLGGCLPAVLPCGHQGGSSQF